MGKREPVELVEIIGRKDQYNKVVEELQAAEFFHPEGSPTFSKVEPEDKSLAELYTRARYVLEELKIDGLRSEMKYEEALRFFERYKPKFEEIYTTVSEISKFLDESAHRRKILTERLNIAKALEGIRTDLLKKEKHTFTLFGVCEKPPSLPSRFLYVIRGEDPWFIVVAGRREDKEEAERLLAQCNFTALPLPERPPEEEREEAERQLKELEIKIRKDRNRLKKIKEEEGSNLLKFFGLLSVFMQRFKLWEQSSFSRFFFSVRGWVPKARLPDLKKLLARFDPAPVLIRLRAKEPGPTKLRQSAYERLFYPIVKMFGVPSHADVDPTPVVSMSFPLFFGLMLADVGYGFLLFLIALYFYYARKDNQIALFLAVLSLSTMAAGALFGSFFAGVVPIKPLWFDPLKQPTNLLELAIFLGALHFISAGVYSLIKHYRDPKAVFSDSLPLLSFGFAAISLLVGINPLPFVVLWILPLLIGRGPFGLLDITGLFGNLVSYSRIMALSISGAVFGQVIKTLAGPGLLAIPVILIGHLLNFGMNVFGSFLHTLRLHFVEYMPKFFDGNGREFKPLSLKSDYIVLKR